MFRKKRDFRLYGERKSIPRRVFKAIAAILFIFIMYIFISSLFLTSVAAGSVSMEPALSTEDRILVTPLVFGPEVPFIASKLPAIRSPRRGEIVLVRPPYYSISSVGRLLEPVTGFFTGRRIRLDNSAGLDREESLLLRRVVAIPGDTIYLEGFIAYIKPNGGTEFISELDFPIRRYEPSIRPLPDGWTDSLPLAGNVPEIVLGDDEYYLISDNRSVSNDSRYWGPLSAKSIVGKVLLRYWPVRSIGVP